MVSEPATAAAGLRFAPGVIHRTSKRGLVIANRHGETVLFEHPRAAGLPTLLAVTPTPDQLAVRLGPCLLLLVVAAGAGCLVAGPPGGQLSGASPATQVLLLLVLGLATSLIHEFAHAVVLVHYGRTPRYAGFGLYWGAVSFYVDSTPALTLPRR